MEVYQVATSIARRFNLNVPAVEAIALGHDVGHTPFGHAGEEALNGKLSSIGGFHHAAHSVRSLDHLAYDSHIIGSERTCGLNLTFAVRQGILKHGWFSNGSTPYHLPPTEAHAWNLAGSGVGLSWSTEAQVVALADEIAYLNHDIEDLILYGVEKVLSPAAIRVFFDSYAQQHQHDGAADWKTTQEHFLNLLAENKALRVKRLVRDAIDASRDRMKPSYLPKSLPGNRIIDFSEPIRRTRNLFYAFFKECIYSDVRIKHKNELAKECILFLFDFFEKFFVGNLNMLPLHIQRELELKPPWWHEYFGKLRPSNSSPPAEDVNTDSSIACKLAAADLVADLTDREALETRDALNRAESGAGMEAIDRMLSTFPTERMMELTAERDHATTRALKGLFSFPV